MGILQARILEWVAIPFSRASSQPNCLPMPLFTGDSPGKNTGVGCHSLLQSIFPTQLFATPLFTGDSPGKNTGAGCHSLLQSIFPTQGLNPGLLHCRQVLSHLSHQADARIYSVTHSDLFPLSFQAVLIPSLPQPFPGKFLSL